MKKKAFIDTLSQMKPNEIQEYIKKNGVNPKKIIPYFFITKDKDSKLLSKQP